MPTGEGGAPAAPKPSERTVFLDAERQQESGGNYLVVNANSGALGAWQVMPSNLPGWLRESGQKAMSAYAYLHDPAAQNKLASVILGGAYDKYGPEGAASWWYSGQTDWHATYGDPPVYQYVADVMALMKKGGFTVNTTAPPAGPGSYTLPPPNQDDWSVHVASVATAHVNAAAGLTRYAAAIKALM
jgi:Transglycosylase SLT domain